MAPQHLPILPFLFLLCDGGGNSKEIRPRVRWSLSKELEEMKQGTGTLKPCNGRLYRPNPFHQSLEDQRVWVPIMALQFAGCVTLAKVHTLSGLQCPHL